MLKEANVLNRALAQALADHIGCHDCRKSPLDTFFGHDPSQSRVIVESLRSGGA